MPDFYREPVSGAESVSSAEKQINPLEQEILGLEKQLAKKRADLQQEKPASLEQVLQKENPAVFPSGTVTAPVITDVAAIKQDSGQIRPLEKNQQLKALVDLAFTKGVAHAVEVVRDLDNPYLIDEFHDTLVDEFRKALIERGKLEEI
jgi:hypothetical protein